MSSQRNLPEMEFAYTVKLSTMIMLIRVIVAVAFLLIGMVIRFKVNMILNYSINKNKVVKKK